MNGCGGGGTASRCVAVWVVTTGAVAAVLWWLHPDLAGAVRSVEGPAPTLEAALGEAAALAATACAVWGWAVTTATVAQVAAGLELRRVPGCPAAWQAAVVAACGVAVLSALAAPAQSHEGRGDAGRRAGVVAGLPLPDRPTGGVPRRPAAATVLVRPGDSLWSLAADRFPAGADGARVTAAWRRLYAANRATVGPDPDLILPGQRLALGTLGGRP
jgi:hypothetical protein